MKSTSSQQSCPTSATYRSPVTGSKSLRHGLRRPYAQTSSQAPPAPSANGLSEGTVYPVPVRKPGKQVVSGAVPAGSTPFTSTRRILPSRVFTI